MYANEDGAELFGELFAIKNTTGYEEHLVSAYWKRAKPPASALRRLEQAEEQVKSSLAGYAAKVGIDPEAIL